MSKPIVEVAVLIQLRPIVIRVKVDTSEDGEWSDERIKASAKEIALDRYKHDDERPEVKEVNTCCIMP